MRALGILVLLSASALLFVLATSCGPQMSPEADDTLIGALTVTATLRSNACAPGLNPTTPTTFGARLSVDDGVATWATASGTVRGTATASTFHVVGRSEIPVFSGCVLDQTETIDGTYSTSPADAGSPDAGPAHSATVTGTDSITISTRSGDACLNVLIINGGSFPMIPCTAVLDFTGRTD